MSQFTNPKNIVDYQYVEVIADVGTAESNLNSVNTITITSPTDSANFALIESRLHVQGYIAVDNQGTAYEPVDIPSKIALQNGGWRLFDRVSFQIDSKDIEVQDFPGEMVQARGLLKHDDDYTKGRGKPNLWALDRGIDSRIQNPYPLRVELVGTAVTYQDLQGTNAATQVLSIGAAAAGATKAYILWNGAPVDIYRTTGVARVHIPFLAAANAATVFTDAVAGSTNASIYEFYVDNRRLRIYGFSGTEVLFGNDSTNIVFSNGLATAVVAGGLIGVLDGDEYENEGFELRRMRTIKDTGFNTNKLINLYLDVKDVFQMIESNPTPMSGNTYSLKLQVNDPSQYLYSNAGGVGQVFGNARFRFTKLSWWIPKITYTEEVQTNFMEYIFSPYELDYTKWESRLSGTSFNARTGSWRIGTPTQVPSQLIVYFQKISKFNSRTGNNNLYDNLDLSNINVKLGSDQFPEQEYQINYGLISKTQAVGGLVAAVDNSIEEDYIRVYDQYLNSCEGNQFHYNCKPLLDEREFKELYPIYVFDLYSRGKVSINNFSSQEMVLNWKLNSQPDEDYRIFAMWKVDTKVIVDTLKRITTVIQ